METFVITLERTPGRFQTFTRSNALHDGIVRFEAVDGLADEVASRLSRLKAATGLKYSAGAFGAALSHEALWHRAVASNAPITVCEDDAVLHADFAAESTMVLAFLGDDWDFVLWGWNFDAPLVAELHPRLCPVVMSLDQASLRLNWAGYVRAPVMPTALRLRSAFGIPCYSISPTGARKFLSRCFPLKNFDWTIPFLNRRVANYGIDVAMCPAYQDTASFACFPPLAVTENDQTISTIQNA